MPVMARQSARSIAERQRVRDARAREQRNFDQLAGQFESHMRSVDFFVCIECRKSVLGHPLPRNKCSTCRRSNINLFSAENNMNFGPVPPQLTGLSLIEQIIIARVQPMVSVFKIRGQQRGYSGHCVNFCQSVQQLARELPHRPSSLDSIVLLNRQTPSGLVQFRVRSAVVLRALRWLKANNPFYSDIIINMEIIAELPEDGDVSSQLRSVDSQETVEQDEIYNNQIQMSCYPNIPVVDQQRELSRNLRQQNAEQVDGEINWPAIDHEPLNEFTEEGIICRAFPCLFPYGVGDLNSPRVHGINRHAYFKFLMRYHDGRFANDTRFPYYAYNVTARKDAIDSGNIYVRLNEMRNMTAEDLHHIVNDPDNELAQSIMYYGENLRRTRSYWTQRYFELVQMIRQLGLPTIFFTLSAADYHWPDLFRILYQSDNINVIQIPEQQRRKLMHENPATVASFFELRAEQFMDKFMKKFFNVSDYWYRYEWQHRGSPHIHGLLWFEGAINRSNLESMSDEEREEVANYFDSIVKAKIGNVSRSMANPCTKRLSDLTQEDRVNDLDKLLVSVQRHTLCGSHCQRRKSGSSRYSCRFGFPINLEERSSVRLDEGSFKFFPKRNDRLLQRYNPFVTQVWRGNTDFSAILSKSAVVNYIAKYTSKAEVSSDSFSETLRKIINSAAINDPAARVVRRLLVSSVDRNYSAQEITHLILGLPLYHMSRRIVILSIKDDWQPYQLGSGETTSKLVRKYSERPGELEDISLFNFSRFYRIVRHRIERWTKECIVRVVPYMKLTDDVSTHEDYYKYQTKLHIPWRGEFVSILPNGITWKDFFLANINLIANDDLISLSSEAADDEFVSEPEDPVIMRDANLAAARLGPPSQFQDQLGQRILDEAHDWTTIDNIDITIEEVNEYLRTYKAAPRLIENQQNNVINYDNLSEKQQEVVQVFERQLADVHCPTKRVIVQGKAGTGKSAVIKFICDRLDNQYRQGNKKNYVVLAPTGAAAMNIDGKTLHNFFRIPVTGPLNEMNGESLRLFQLKIKRIKFVIIDEYSMIGLRFLNKINTRLCEGQGDFSQPFGGKKIYLFGDLRQLPPVKDIPIYMNAMDDNSVLGLRSILSFQRHIVLTECHRQGHDQINFKRALDNISIGCATQGDFDLLMSRRLTLHPNIPTRHMTHLFPTNEKVTEHNKSILAENNLPVALIESLNNNTIAKISSENLAGGLPRHLYLSTGCRIILRKNICVDKGLVNGSLGTVRYIVYNEEERPPLFPLFILIKFDKFTGPFFKHDIFEEGLFPLYPSTAKWRKQGSECKRKQFPITLSYAITIHKAQGLTLDEAVVDIGLHEKSIGLSYVALSRVRRLENLFINPPFNYTRLTTISRIVYTHEREAFMRSLGIH